MNQAQKILQLAEKYNQTQDILKDLYNIGADEVFDAVVLAPSWTPAKILKNYAYEQEERARHAYTSAYTVQFAGHRLAWFQCASGANNLIDTALALANQKTDKVIFMGAVGALKREIGLGDMVTPSESYAFEGGSMYLGGQLEKSSFGRTVRPHNREWIDRVLEKAAEAGVSIEKKKVFCTDSILCEYSYLEQILDTGAELIEMETAAFSECMQLMGKNGIALLCVSDNSTTGISLMTAARSEAETAHYHRCRTTWIPEMLKIICEMK